MTDWSGFDTTDYYTTPAYSPDGRFLTFRTSRAPYRFVMNSDGTDERAFGVGWGSLTPWDEDEFMSRAGGGVWSHDSRTYFAYGRLYAIDVATDVVTRISTTPAAFFSAYLSPDGRTLLGGANRADLTGPGTTWLELINIDGTDYRQFTPPYRPDGTGIDVTHGWLGSDLGWYLNDVVDLPDPAIVFDVHTGAYVGYLEVDIPGNIWDGIFGHTMLSAEATFMGPGFGLVSGHGRGVVKTGNTRFSHAADPMQRDVPGDPTNTASARAYAPIVDPDQFPEFAHPLGLHSNFSPDGRWLAVASSGDRRGVLSVYPIDRSSTPIWLARWDAPSTEAYSCYQGWSPDGTKVSFYSAYLDADGEGDVYVAVFRRPDAPTDLRAVASGGEVHLTWTPAQQHREIKEYKVLQGSSADGPFCEVGTVPAVYTYVDTPSRLSATATMIPVDSTDGFPASGTLEILGLSTERASELVSYSAKTATSFTGCVRGALGTVAAEHWHDAFVWKHTGTDGYHAPHMPGAWFKVRTVEWSGLTSELSEPVSAP